MIIVTSIAIEEFRGIRDLKLDLNGKNFAVSGPNGTGKSGIVDAVEFGLTGSISRLTGKGRGSVSVKAHGPHVNCRNNPERAVVTLEVLIPSLAKKATIRRSIKAPKAPVILPDEPAVRAAFAELERHPEFTLSRREIIKYVLAEPGERAKEIQALLQLDELETARATLLKIKNSVDRELKTLEPQRNMAAESLRRALEIPELKQAPMLEAVNAKRAVLGLAPLAKIEATTSIRDGLDSIAAPAAVKVPKVQALADVAAAKEALDALVAEAHQAQVAAARDALLKLKASEAKLDSMTRDAMLAAALELFDGESCPVCQTEWNPEEFRAVVQVQRQELEEAAKERKAAEELIAPIWARWQTAHDAFTPLVNYGPKFPTPIDVTSAKTFRDDLTAQIKTARAFLPLAETLASLEADEEKFKK